MRLTIAVSLLIAALTSEAASHYVTQSGAGSANGTSLGNAWSVASFNASGTPAAGDLCWFRVSRDVSDAADTHAEDARLIGVKVLYTINAATDA